MCAAKWISSNTSPMEQNRPSNNLKFAFPHGRLVISFTLIAASS